MKHWICALGVAALAAWPAVASTTYDFGSATNISLSDETTSYSAAGTNGTWTEDYVTGGPDEEQIDCVVAVGTTADVCGTSGTHLGAAANVSLTGDAPTGSLPSCSTNCGYLLADGAPQYGAAVSIDMTDLVVGDVYQISYYQAATEESPVGTVTAYDDNWNVYVLPGSDAGTYICPQTYCTTQTAAPTGSILNQGAEMDTSVVDGAQVPTSWEQQTFTFTATAVSQVLEFVTNVETSTGGVPTSFQPPLLGLADVTLTPETTTPEPGTWVLTLIGIGLMLAGGMLRRRSSARG